MLKVSVVIPTYNGLHLLQQNLPKVHACLRPGDEIVVVDDASTDGTIEWLKKKSREFNLTIVHNTRNKRFAASCNRGIRTARKELIFLLNNDVAPEKDVLKYLLPHFEQDERVKQDDVFGVGCLEIEGMVNQNGKDNLAQESEEESTNQKKVFGGKNTLWFKRGMFIHARASNFESGQTAWVSGGSGLFDKQKFLGLGGFDVSYAPAYWEDVDIAFRARLQGWKVLFEKQAIVHHEHESTNKDAFGQVAIQAVSWRNACYFTWKNSDVWQRLAYVLWKPYWWWKRRAMDKQ